MVDFFNIDKSWTLFLDRDGVINKKLDNDYVKTVDELEFLPNALAAIANFSNFFGQIIIITNQQGIGKGLMSEQALTKIHRHLITKVKEAGGKIDAIYHAPQLVAEKSAMRKPEIGMAVKARNDFPAIDFTKSIMVGDSQSDMEFGRRAKMVNVLVGNNSTEGSKNYTIASLDNFSKLLDSILNKYS